MSNKRPWYKKPAIVVPIIVAIIGAIAIIVVPIIEEKLNRQELSTIRGTVTDTDGMQVAGAVIEIDGLSGTTDDRGVYVIRDVPVGTRTVIVYDAHRVEVLRRTLRITRGGETIIFDIVLQPPVTPTPTPMPTGILDVNPAAFVIQGREFLLDTRYNPIPGLPIEDGVDLSNYDLEFTFQGGDGRRVQLWYKDSEWRNVYSFPYIIESGQPIRYNPFTDGRNVAEFNDFTHIYAIGAKVFGGVEGIRITSVKLIERD